MACSYLIAFISFVIIPSFVVSQEHFQTSNPIAVNPDTNILHEILTLETDLRIELQKTVQSLLKDVAILKNDRDSLKQQVNELVNTNQLLNQQYASLKKDFDSLNISCCNHVTNSQRNTTQTVTDLEKKYRYLSLSFLDLQSKTDNINKSNHHAVEESSKKISEQISSKISNITNDLTKTSAEQKKLTSSFLALRQNISTVDSKLSSSFATLEATRSLDAGRFNASITSLRTSLSQTEQNQISFSTLVTALQQNVSVWKKDIIKKLPAGVAFHARLRNSITHLNKGQTIIFDNEVTDTSNCYDGHTGIFTAPISGIYVFNWNLMSYDRTGMDTTLTSTSGQLGFGFIGYASPDNNGGNMVVARVTKGTKVWVMKADTYGNYLHERFTTFSGFLIFKSE